MKKAAITLVLLASGIAWAQPPADCKPSALNVPGAPYPCVFPDHRAMFRVAAPNAQSVRVRVGTGFDLKKEADGLWYVTTTPLVEGFHYYLLNIDGATFADPSTRTFFGGGTTTAARFAKCLRPTLISAAIRNGCRTAWFVSSGISQR